MFPYYPAAGAGPFQGKAPRVPSSRVNSCGDPLRRLYDPDSAASSPAVNQATAVSFPPARRGSNLRLIPPGSMQNARCHGGFPLAGQTRAGSVATTPTIPGRQDRVLHPRCKDVEEAARICRNSTGRPPTQTVRPWVSALVTRLSHPSRGRVRHGRWSGRGKGGLPTAQRPREAADRCRHCWHLACNGILFPAAQDCVLHPVSSFGGS